MKVRWRELAERVRHELRFYRLVLADKRTPWFSRILLGAAIAYLLSPVDLIPDFIPVLGHLDDLIVIPILVTVAVTMIPREVIVDCRRIVESGPVD